MAIEHTFICDDCKTTIKDVNTYGAHRCMTCGKTMRWDLNFGIHGNYSKPIHSDALAIHPDQRAEHEVLFPNIRIDKQNRPIFDNYVDHENYLKKTGFVKQTKRIRPKSVRIH